LAVKKNLAAGRPVIPGDDLDQGRFVPCYAEQTDDLFLRTEIDIVQRLNSPNDLAILRISRM
jgi:hypothetical protein